MNSNQEMTGAVAGAKIADWPPRWKVESFLFGGLVLAGHALLLWLFLRDPWTRAIWVLPFLVSGGLYLFWQRWVSLETSDFTPDDKAAVWLLATGGVILAAATFFGSPWLGLVAFLCSFSGYAFWWGGRVWFRCWWPLLLLLGVFLRPPVELDLPTLAPTAFLQTSLVGKMLDRLGVINVISGTLVEIPGHQISGHHAYSSVAMKLVLAGAALFIGLKRRRPWWQLAALVVGLFVFLGLNEVLWLTLCVLVDAKLGVNPLAGLGRWVVLLLNFAVTLGLVASLDHLLNCMKGFLRPPDPRLAVRTPLIVVGVPAKASVPAATSKPEVPTHWHQLRVQLRIMSQRPVPWWGWGLGLFFCLAGMVQLIWAPILISSQPSLPPGLQTNLVTQMPEQLGGWVQTVSPQTTPTQPPGSPTRQMAWNYQWGDLKAKITLSYPFKEFEPRNDVLWSSGWKVNNYRVDLNQVAAQSQPLMEVQMSRPPAQSGLLLEAYFTPQGQWLKPRVWHWIPSQMHLLEPPVTAFRLRLLAQEYLPMKAHEAEEVRRLFFAARNYLVPDIMKRVGGAP